jgi:hypothetical protein
LRPNPGLKLIDQVREVLRDYRDAYRTEQTSGHWIRRDLPDCGGKTPPHRLETQEVERFLAHLAIEGQVSASTERQALNPSTEDWYSGPSERPVRLRSRQFTCTNAMGFDLALC